MPLLKEETYTIDDIYALPEGENISISQQDLPVLLTVTLKNTKENVRFMQHHLPFIWMKEAILM